MPTRPAALQTERDVYCCDFMDSFRTNALNDRTSMILIFVIILPLMRVVLLDDHTTTGSLIVNEIIQVLTFKLARGRAPRYP